MKTSNPALEYPFISKVSPYEDLIEQHVQLCIESYSCLPHPVKNAYKKAGFGTLAPNVFPNAECQALFSIGRWILLGFAFDDYYDPCSKDEFSIVCKKAIDILNGSSPDAEDADFFKEFAILRDKFQSVSTPYWMERFIADQVSWLEGMKEEAAYSYKGILKYPGFDEYVSIREKISGGLILCDFLEIASGFIMPEEVFRSPFIQKLRQKITHIIAWCNDIHGVEREIQRNEVMNIVLVIKNEKKCSLEAAYDHAIRIHNDNMEEFIKLSQNIPDFGPYQPGVEDYIQNGKLLLQGQKEWHERSERYKEVKT